MHKAVTRNMKTKGWLDQTTLKLMKKDVLYVFVHPGPVQMSNSRVRGATALSQNPPLFRSDIRMSCIRRGNLRHNEGTNLHEFGKPKVQNWTSLFFKGRITWIWRMKDFLNPLLTAISGYGPNFYLLIEREQSFFAGSCFDASLFLSWQVPCKCFLCL